MIEIKPQEGAQTEFLTRGEDVVLFGGSAGGSKSYSLLLESLRHVQDKNHRAIIFRRTSPQLRSSGSVYNEAKDLFGKIGAKCNDTQMKFKFPSGAEVGFGHLQGSDQHLAYQGSAYSMVGFDEATHFTQDQTVYLISRLRNPSITPYARLTCNPDANSYLKKWVEPYLDSSGQYPDPEKIGKTYWIGFGGEDGNISFNHERDDLHPLSYTFVPATLNDNKILTNSNPRYREMLLSLPLVERNRLLYGDWSISYTGGNIYKREWIREWRSNIPNGNFYLGFDLASTVKNNKNKDPDWSAACLIQKNGLNHIIHRVWRVRQSGTNVYSWMQGVINDAIRIKGGNILRVYMEVEPGSASKREIEVINQRITGIKIEGIPSSSSKIVRSRSSSAAMESGKISIINDTWNEDFLKEMESFPDGSHDDMIDSFTLAYNQSCGHVGI